MLVGGMVRHEIKDDLEAACVREFEKCIEVGERAEKRVHMAQYSLTSYPKSRIGEGKIGEIQTASIPRPTRCSKPVRNPLEIADAIPIRVLERSGIHLVDHFPLPPILLHNHSKVFRCGVLCSLREKKPRAERRTRGKQRA